LLQLLGNQQAAQLLARHGGKSRCTAPAQDAASRLADALDDTSRRMRSGLAWKPKSIAVSTSRELT